MDTNDNRSNVIHLSRVAADRAFASIGHVEVPWVACSGKLGKDLFSLSQTLEMTAFAARKNTTSPEIMARLLLRLANRARDMWDEADDLSRKLKKAKKRAAKVR